MRDYIYLHYPNSFYNLATKLKNNLIKRYGLMSIQFLGASEEETGIFYYWNANLDSKEHEIRIEKEPYKTSDYTQFHSVHFREIGTFKWYNSEFIALVTIEVEKD